MNKSSNKATTSEFFDGYKRHLIQFKSSLINFNIITKKFKELEDEMSSGHSKVILIDL